MQATQPREDSFLQSGDRTKYLGLRAVLQFGLKADHVPERTERIILAQLDHRIGLFLRIVVIG